ncbi:MAG TPA: HAMP domain-containing sensor histidine kinase [Gemmatimonadaceae bacterium]|nr:HAMP domain-containing sensor histidine kinase [Gemmatimonadaceae bacterium]
MDSSVNCRLASVMAARLREAQTELTTRWLDRISERVSINPNRIFPTEELLDHAPRLVSGVADYIEDPSRALAADTDVISKARELGALRHEQGFDEFEILKEYEIFGGILFNFLARIVGEEGDDCSRAEMALVAHRLFQAISLVQQATATQYLQLMMAQLGEREERLRSFNRALTHELRNRMGAISGAAQLLEIPELSDPKRRELGSLIVRNATGMRVVLEDLLELSRVSDDARQQRHVRLTSAASEVRRHLRDAAKSAGVQISIASDLPDVEVSAAAVELCLMNLISNAIKYADPAKKSRIAEVRGYVMVSEADRPSEVVVEVHDNGIGVPPALRTKLFERFFRAHKDSVPAVDGTGLGLSIVRETVEALGGRVWAEFPQEGSVFAFAIPCRRTSDMASIGEYARLRRESEERHP